MPRKGNGNRTRRTMRAHAQTRLANEALRTARAFFEPQQVAERASRRVHRVTGVEIPSHAVFSAMGIRQVNGVAGRGAWLTGRAMDESIATDRRTEQERRADAHAARERRESAPTLADHRRAIRLTGKRVDAIYAELAYWSAWDEIVFAAVFQGVQDRFFATGDEKILGEELDALKLWREASREWEDRLLVEARAGQLDVQRLRALVKAQRRNDVVNGRSAPSVADFPLWFGVTPDMPRVIKRARPVLVASPEPVANAVTVITAGNKFMDKALNTD